MEFDKNGSPFIQFPAPLQNLRITSPLYTDGAANKKMLNDSRVYMYLVGPPYPYTDESWNEWWPIMSKSTDTALEEFKEVKAGTRKWTSNAPFNTIREMNSDGSEGQYIGSIGLRKRDFSEILDEVEKKRLLEENGAYEAGDARTAWEVGFFLTPEAHGRGIMPVALRLLMEVFMVPYMNAHLVVGSFFDNNPASRRVFEKNGFEFVSLTPDAHEIVELKAGYKGMKVGIGLMMWKRKDVQESVSSVCIMGR